MLEAAHTRRQEQDAGAFPSLKQFEGQHTVVRVCITGAVALLALVFMTECDGPAYLCSRRTCLQH